MASVMEHYETHLAPIYSWMVGGIDNALLLGAQDLSDVIASDGQAVDLGAGFGMHSIPLARAGYHVLAVDTSAYLLEELQRNSVGTNVEVRQCNMLAFAEHLHTKADLIICMGDTLTHLQSMDEVDVLCQRVAEWLKPGGKFVATFRDYTRLPEGASRFIPVRSDANRIHTCFLEEKGDHLVVYDLINERADSGWSLKVSSYEKLRVSPQALKESLSGVGLQCTLSSGPRGMIKLIADA